MLPHAIHDKKEARACFFIWEQGEQVGEGREGRAWRLEAGKEKRGTLGLIGDRPA